ncbi:4'-phosphopantetheinyl transferase family protein [Flocculibacter collagenilyticus]|uniref:4'-phosphopantetheinyl transferase family protein n=1 Tax=Flocculibacter collagenilyticus TaxID=2744479 RepID=UPI0018F2EC20|nr:4'-phosphopantetheinyl transferase superfamily protein [Flocculibacter collagenilyticus]
MMNPSVAYFHQQDFTISRAELAIQNQQSFLDRLLHEQLYLPSSMQHALLKRQCEFMAGRWCAVQAMKQVGLNHIVQPCIGQNNEPIWPANVNGSISHTDETAVAVAIRPNKPSRGIGIDRENILASEHAERFAKKIMSQKERSLSDHISDNALFVTIVFSSKEALFKAMFPQIRRTVDFSVAQLSHIDTTTQTLELTLSQTLSEQLQQGRQITVSYSHIANTIEACTIV